MARNLIQNGFELFLRGGPLELLKGVISFVWWRTFRSMMPTMRNVEIDGVYFEEAIGHKMGDNVFSRKKISYGQQGETIAHETFSQKGDDVIIVGGGRGTTAVHAARQVGDRGSVTVYEGGEIANLVEVVARLNGVGGIVSVKKAIVGDAHVLYQGRAESVEVISPENLPKCDVLEMDCEGSELDILAEMVIRPRILIVELHPRIYDGPNEQPIEIISKMGYIIQYRARQSGKKLGQREFQKRLKEGKGDVIAAISKHVSDS